MKLYKLTDEKHQTKNECQWGKDVTHSVEEGSRNAKLCSSGVIHACQNPNLALLLNPMHANISNPVLWEAEGEIVVEDWEKVGCHELTTTRQMDLPGWYTDLGNRKQVMVQFAVFCAESVLAQFERGHPQNKGPRKAIIATMEYLKNPSAANAKAANTAANASSDIDTTHGINVAGDAAYYAAIAVARDIEGAAIATATAAANASETSVEIDFYELADKAVKVLD